MGLLSIILTIIGLVFVVGFILLIIVASKLREQSGTMAKVSKFFDKCCERFKG